MKSIDFRIFRTHWIPDLLPIGSLWLETSATALCGPYVNISCWPKNYYCYIHLTSFHGCLTMFGIFTLLSISSGPPSDISMELLGSPSTWRCPTFLGDLFQGFGLFDNAVWNLKKLLWFVDDSGTFFYTNGRLPPAKLSLLQHIEKSLGKMYF